MTKEIALIAIQVRIGPETNKRLAGYAVGKHTFPLYSGAYGVISMYSITQEGTTAINGRKSPAAVSARFVRMVSFMTPPVFIMFMPRIFLAIWTFVIVIKAKTVNHI